MLTNTVILFIKDILPIFILLCFIATCIAPLIFTRKNVVLLVILTLLGVFLIYKYIATLSEIYDGGGVELLKIVVNSLVYISLLLSSSYIITGKALNRMQQFALLASLILFSAINLSEFLLFFSTYLTNHRSVTNTIVGTLFGLGICMSFSALFTLAILSLVKKNNWLMQAVWALYLSGLSTQSINQLQQIDVINTGNILWDTSAYISDASEYGYLLNALFGYISVPTLEYFVVYFVNIAVYILLYISLKKQTQKLRFMDTLRGKQ